MTSLDFDEGLVSFFQRKMKVVYIMLYYQSIYIMWNENISTIIHLMNTSLQICANRRTSLDHKMTKKKKKGGKKKKNPKAVTSCLMP